jgi:hypothetical protein
MFVGVGFLGLLFSGAASQKQTATVQQKPEISSCRSDWHQCADNADLVNNYLYEAGNSTPIETDCKLEAGKRAKYMELRNFRCFILSTSFNRATKPRRPE